MTIILIFHFDYKFWKEHKTSKRRVVISTLRNKRNLVRWLETCFLQSAATLHLHESLQAVDTNCQFWTERSGCFCIEFQREPVDHMSLREIRQLLFEEPVKRFLEHFNEIQLDEIQNQGNFVPGMFDFFINIKNVTDVHWSFRDTLIRNSVERDFEDPDLSDDDRGD